MSFYGRGMSSGVIFSLWLPFKNTLRLYQPDLQLFIQHILNPAGITRRETNALNINNLKVLKTMSCHLG